MVRTNLSTRPFYNVRAFRALLGLVALLLVGLSVMNALQWKSLRASEGTLSARATEALDQASRLRAEAAAIQAQVDPRELEAVAAAARDANVVIHQRAFSWSRFLTEVEGALPSEVRVRAVQPYAEAGDVRVAIVVEAMEAEDLATFMNALEDQGTFSQILPLETTLAADDVLDATIDGVYVPAAAPAGITQPEATRGEDEP